MFNMSAIEQRTDDNRVMSTTENRRRSTSVKAIEANDDNKSYISNNS